MLAHIRNSVARKRNRSRGKKKTVGTTVSSSSNPPAAPVSPNPARKQRSRHSYAAAPTAAPASHGREIDRTLDVAFSSLSLEEQQRELERAAHFRRNLGKLLRAHDHNWRKVPFFFFVDEWISDEGETITKNRLKQAEAARRKFGIAN